MDHIHDAGVTGLSFTVPYLVDDTNRYDGQGWQTFPRRAGYPRLCDSVTVQDLNSEYQTLIQREFQAFAQTWMFFGVLHDFLGNGFDEADFVTRDE